MTPKLNSQDLRYALLLLALLVVVLVPWLGETLFNTKGEPREAIVAVSMLDSGNWVLPTSYGSDIPYKPPLLAWLIALSAKIFNGGEVNEFVSRLPSAVALIFMIMMGYRWACRVRNRRFALTMSLVTLTCFEVFRAGIICRVDMVLTACMVGALYMLWEWRRLYIQYAHRRTSAKVMTAAAAVLLLTGGVMAKGPVGALLPCLVFGLFCLFSGDNFFKTLGGLTAVCIASMVLPAIWYMAAYRQGGQDFANLAWEENIGRLTGTMSYESHLKPWWYNVTSVLSGMLPWTLLVLMSLAVVRFKNINIGRLRHLSDGGRMALTAAIVVFVFYCIPSSKRSVYLLPMYPFMAYGVAQLLEGLQIKAHYKILNIYTTILAAVAVAAPVVVLVGQWLPLGRFEMQTMHIWQLPLILVPLTLSTIWFMRKSRKADSGEQSSPVDAKCDTKPMLAFAVSLVFAYTAVVQPMILNGQSDAHAAQVVDHAATPTARVYTLIDDPYMRYYTINFYMHDRLRRLESVDTMPTDGAAVLLAPESMPLLKQKMAASGRDTTAIDTVRITSRSCDTRAPIIMYKIK